MDNWEMYLDDKTWCVRQIGYFHFHSINIFHFDDNKDAEQFLYLISKTSEFSERT